MRATLSHTLGHDPARPSRARSGRCFVVTCAIAAVLPLSLVACNQVESDRAQRGSTPKSASATQPAFSWPEDPSHPVLEIQVEIGADAGTIRIELMPELAPTTVAEVIERANNGYYDDTTFHRVIPGFMIQGGDPNTRDKDPTNDGHGDLDVNFRDEFGGAPFERGVVGMGNSGRPNSTSLQFFIMHENAVSLNGRYTAIGRTLSGIEQVDAIAKVSTDRSGRWGPKDRPVENVVMKRVRTIGEVAALKEASPSKAVITNSEAESTEKSDSSPLAKAERPSTPPASMNSGEDWERLEAGGR